MHGNEGAPRQILRSLRGGAAIHGVDLWLVPVYNPDGLAAHTAATRTASTSTATTPTTGPTSTATTSPGPGPASEPETRAMMRFLGDIRPDYVLSFHQPLHGVDTDNKRPAFSRRVAHTLHLPATTLDCGGVCHGTMTGWFNHHFKGFALTVEYGARPPARLMRATAPRQVLAIFRRRSPARATRPRLTRISADPPDKLRAGQRPWKTGFSLATNAATAARWSSVAPVLFIIWPSSTSDSSKVCEAA